MRKLLTILALVSSLTATGKGKTPLRAGTYELSNSFNRRVQAEGGKMSPQRMWCNCAAAVADAIIETVKYKVEHFTGIPVGRVNVCVEDIRV